jgi:SOS response regulatory protein OraA/RecX
MWRKSVCLPNIEEREYLEFQETKQKQKQKQNLLRQGFFM